MRYVSLGSFEVCEIGQLPNKYNITYVHESIMLEEKTNYFVRDSLFIIVT